MHLPLPKFVTWPAGQMMWHGVNAGLTADAGAAETASAALAGTAAALSAVPAATISPARAKINLLGVRIAGSRTAKAPAPVSGGWRSPQEAGERRARGLLARATGVGPDPALPHLTVSRALPVQQTVSQF